MKSFAKFQEHISFSNTLTRKKEIFHPINPPLVKIYTCGPTVYDFAHIGNFRTYVFEDLVRRLLKFFGYQVEQVMNLTDIDDKTIKNARAKNISLKEYVAPYITAFFEDLKSLNIEDVEHNPRATDYVEQMIVFIQELIQKGVAYQGGDGSVYFSVAKSPHYGKLSHLKMDELKVGERVSHDEYEKECVGDFVLWKGYDEKRDGEIYWESPFGKGRPGWHLECSTMAMDILGNSLDIHMGAVDNIFPHHENEIAQSECRSGCCFSRFWVHSEHLIVEGKKMSKSLGNFYTLRNLLEKGYSGKDVRFLLLQTHYKTQLNFTFEALEGARSGLRRLQATVETLLERAQEGKATSSVEKQFDSYLEEFCYALADDVNTSKALAAVFDAAHFSNKEKLHGCDAMQALDFFKNCNQILGILDFIPQNEAIPEELEKLLEERISARNEKNWKRADEIRDLIHKKGYVIEDRQEGARLKKA